MSVMTFSPVMFLAILPELALVLLGIVIFIFDLFFPKEQRENLGWVTSIGLCLIIIASLLLGKPSNEPQSLWGGMIRDDWYGFVFKILFLFAAAITSLFMVGFEKIGKMGEFYLLVLASTLGMCFMASASDLIMVYLAIETTSIPLYILAGFFKQDDKSSEAGFKYLIFGAMTSAILLYGFSLIFGFSSTTNLYTIAQGFLDGKISVALVVGIMALVFVGFGFKISAFPLHFWAPDVYEGAPTPVAGFLSTASKAAGFAVLLRFIMAVFPDYQSYWVDILT